MGDYRKAVVHGKVREQHADAKLVLGVGGEEIAERAECVGVEMGWLVVVVVGERGGGSVPAHAQVA